MQDFLTHASEAYYKGKPFISDAEFDILSSHFDYTSIGHKITNGIPHFYKMYSLKNCFNIEDLPLDPYHCIETPKLDGAAISILFVGGRLSLALTRGDGLIGLNITRKLKLIVPNNIVRQDIVQITGEILAPSNIENSRNYAAGALKLKNLNEFISRDLVFVAYGIQTSIYSLWEEDMFSLEEMGFNDVMTFDTTDYPTDGLVYRINNNEDFDKLGYTAHHPRGAIALKEQKAGVETKLLDVIWQVGKSGVVSPVGILEPIKIGDALVSKATLHNIKYINDLELEIGCQVEVIRSGEVIPRIVRKL